MDDNQKNPTKVAAALARANALSPEDRSAIARRAALARHGRNLPKAVAEGTLWIGDLPLPCAVLDDAGNTRVLTQEGFLTAIGRAGKAKGGEGASVDGKPAFLRAKNLEPFISKDLMESTTPIEFIPWKAPGYQGRAFGYQGKLLPGVCWVYQDALVASRLLPSQRHIGEACKLLLKALTNHAIEDLIDQATGFDDLQKREAIDRLLELYVRKDALPWVKMFDIDFYRHIYRLNRWPFDPANTARPGVIGHWTNDIYDRLAPMIRPELHRRVKRNAKGRPTEKLTQYLTPEEGKPRLRELLEGVKALMRISADWDDYMAKLDIAFPRFGETYQLPFTSGTSVALPKPD
ncbi:MAG TPA: P63C domain-containing protein [Acidiferrobacterales bacterium]